MDISALHCLFTSTFMSMESPHSTTAMELNIDNHTNSVAEFEQQH